MLHLKDFMCICTSEAKARSEECLERVFKELGCTSDEPWFPLTSSQG